jgi:glycosyltransferase involved in cell wall biosynthesis
MKILFVAMSNSIHTSRWIGQIANQGWDIHVFPSIDFGDTHPELRNVTIYHSIYGKKKNKNTAVRLKGSPVFSNALAWAGRWIIKYLNLQYRRDRLIQLIEEIKPDIIHSLEFQNGGYLVLDAKREFLKRHINQEKFPPWIATNWGSDLYYFSRFSEHKEKIKEILEQCDYYSCECGRDIDLAKKLGFQGKYLPVIPNAGGFDIEKLITLRESKKTSHRRIILLKGYHGWAGRALVGLDAIEQCASDLKNYEVLLYSCHSREVMKKVQDIQEKTGISISIVPQVSHDELMKIFEESRVYLGLSISDAISTSLLESMITGAFPIQSNTSCADEWIVDGKTGFIVPAEDARIVAEKLSIAIHNDKLVDTAAEINAVTAQKRLDSRLIKKQVIFEYEKIFTDSHKMT